LGSVAFSIPLGLFGLMSGRPGPPLRRAISSRSAATQQRSLRKGWTDRHNVGHAHEFRHGNDVAQELNLRCSYSDALIRLGGAVIGSTWPSGAARTMASVAILVLAPGRFSTMICWPSLFDNHSSNGRATISGTPPKGAKPTQSQDGKGNRDVHPPNLPRARRRGDRIRGRDFIARLGSAGGLIDCKHDTGAIDCAFSVPHTLLSPWGPLGAESAP
jgi:hypothetical protein